MNDKLKQQIDLFWKGNLSVEDQKKLLETLQKENDSLYQELEKEFHQRQVEQNNSFPPEYYQQILQQIHEKSFVEKKSPRIRQLVKQKWLLAASVLLVLGFGMYRLQQHVANNKATLADNSISDSTILENVKDKAQIAILPDQSQIILSANSRVAYSPNFGKTDRNLSMHGKVQFNVSHNPELPFVVHTQGYTTTALGTSFIVSSQANERISVNLLTGKVVVNQLDQKAKPIYLLPGEQVIIDKDEVQFIPKPRSVVPQKKEESKPSVKIPEKNADAIIFEDQSLDQVFAKLQEIKDVQIQFDKELIIGHSFTGEFSKDESIEQILELICRMNDLVFEKSGTSILITKKKEEELTIY